ncbi:MAG: TldD/PmbA family protein [Acidimicrobiales bacterium]
MFHLAAEAVQAALDAGARYADARALTARSQTISARNGQIEDLDQTESSGVGVRALIGSSWGFFATAELTERAARHAGELAATTARSSHAAPGPPLALADAPVVSADWSTPVAEDPFAVPLDERCGLLVDVTAGLVAVPGVAQGVASLAFWDTDKHFVSSHGSRIHQRLVESGGGMSATAVGDAETQVRSYPQSFGQFESGGYEVIRRFDLPGHVARVAEEAVALLTAPPCPAGVTTLILDGSQTALQIHESVGHAVELDRILGWEAAFAGTSFLELAELGRLRYGSPLMQITADATLPGALGTFGFDDEGVPAQRVDIVRDGIWVGVLSGRDSAALAGVAPGGMVRADGFNRLPMVRMTNVGLLPGAGSLDDLVADTDDGVLMSTNRSWSIDDRRLNFQFGCEAAWEIKRGRRGRLLRNPTYTGITPQFWAGLDRVAGPAEWVHWGIPNCGKGQPMQSAHTAHSASPTRFRNVRIGVTGSGR